MSPSLAELEAAVLVEQISALRYSGASVNDLNGPSVTKVRCVNIPIDSDEEKHTKKKIAKDVQTLAAAINDDVHKED